MSRTRAWSINYSAGQTRGNNGIAPLSELGEITVRCAQPSGTTHFILDVNGYFQGTRAGARGSSPAADRAGRWSIGSRGGGP